MPNNLMKKISGSLFKPKTDVRIETVYKPSFDITNPLTLLLQKLPESLQSHSIRVAAIAQILAEQAQALPEGMNVFDFAHLVWLGGLYHHIGETAVYTDKKKLPILSETIVEEHISALGVDSLADAETVLAIVRHHCEHYDGSGYPDGLCGEEIPLGASLVGIANLIDCSLVGKNYTPERMEHIVLKHRKKMLALFGQEAADCFIRAQGHIFKLYMEKRQPTPWK